MQRGERRSRAVGRGRSPARSGQQPGELLGSGFETATVCDLDACGWNALQLARLDLRLPPGQWQVAARALGSPGGVAQAMRLAIEGCLSAVDGEHEAGLRALLDGPVPR